MFLDLSSEPEDSVPEPEQGSTAGLTLELASATDLKTNVDAAEKGSFSFLSTIMSKEETLPATVRPAFVDTYFSLTQLWHQVNERIEYPAHPLTACLQFN